MASLFRFLFSLAVFLGVSGSLAAEAAERVIDGGYSPDGRYELRQQGFAVRVVDTRDGREAGRIPLHQPRIADPEAADCSALWHPGGEVFAFLDHDHRYSTRLSLYAFFEGRPVRLAVPDYIQNALGRADATETALPCLNQVGLWNGESLPVILIFNAPGPDGRWVLHNAVVTLKLVPRPGKLPDVKLQQVRMVEKAAAPR